MRITNIKGREIFDSRGFPTLECQLFLEDGVSIVASVPSGISCSAYEAYELRDGGKRLFGKGVLKAIENIETIISPALVGQEPNVILLDQYMIKLDGTDNKMHLGANTILAVSIAILRAQAWLEQRELYEFIAHLCGSDTVSLPFPFINMLSGGAHADTGLRIQEFLILPVGAQSFREAIEKATVFSHTLENTLKGLKKQTSVGIEGALVSTFAHDEEALDILFDVIEQCGGPSKFKIALDIAASQFYNKATNKYDWFATSCTTDDLLGWYEKILSKYHVYSLEDPLHQDDWKGWALLMDLLGNEVQIVGDDLFATDAARIWKGIEMHATNAVVIKPNQIGTVTETLQAIQLCQEYNLNVVISHRSVETNDCFIADLAVGTSSGQIKAGGCNRGERLAKYNRLLTIEDQLAFSLLEP